MSASANAVVADLRDRIRQFDGRALRDHHGLDARAIVVGDPRTDVAEHRLRGVLDVVVETLDECVEVECNIGRHGQAADRDIVS